MLFLSIAFSVIGLTFACPSSCNCKWKGGKQTVECVNKGLITIPDGIDPGTQVLDLSGNNLKLLLRDRFQRMGLINLQRIYLARCRISQIDDKAFRGLTNLVELDLSDNEITSAPTETFFDYPSLMRLILNGNRIRVLKTASFQPLASLTTLELSNCQMEVVEDDAFAGLSQLEWLKLDNNKIQNIRGSNILTENLHGIDLHHNPWLCDCKLIDLRAWLIKYHIPQTIEPICSSPARLEGRLVRSLQVNDLACLPDVTPTTLYLEIAEGKNVSLLCRVSAVPEAKVSWWFQGNILQNDSIIAPGLHLYYYVEEGSVEKRSELFIFNTNIDDNGTFICIAENPAGRSQSNYTIRIVLKEEPVVGLAVFPYEYVILISGVVSIVSLLMILVISLCFIKCRKQRRRKRKKERSKVVALQSQQNFSKAPGIRETSDHITRIGHTITTTQTTKQNGSLLPNDSRQPHEMMLYATDAGVLVVPNNLGVVPDFGSPTSLRTYQLEQNPDLINDMENGKDRRQKPQFQCDQDCGQSSYKDVNDASTDMGKQEMTMKLSSIPEWKEMDKRYPQNFCTVNRRGSREMYQNMTADVHLSPRKFIGSDGYPLDYGLPKMSSSYPAVVAPHSAFYRTLPHKTRHTAANPSSRYSREAEFLSKSMQPAPYEHYTPCDIRYTAEGYPCNQPPVFAAAESIAFTEAGFLLPSPPAPYKGDTLTSPKDASAQWPETCPDGPPPAPLGRTVSQCSVAAQTSDDHAPSKSSGKSGSDAPSSHSNNPVHLPPPVLTESPDEGYEGETVDATEI